MIINWKLEGYNYLTHKSETIDWRSDMKLKFNDKHQNDKTEKEDNDKGCRVKYGSCLFEVLLVIDVYCFNII